jgi:uncharacterized protein YigE (DUF2233 family)
MIKFPLLIACLLAAQSSGGNLPKGLPQPTQGLLERLNTKTAEHQPFAIAGHKYELQRIKITDPADSRYGLSVVWITVPAAGYQLSVVDIRRDGNAVSAFEAAAHPQTDILLMNGGYFGQKDSTHSIPIGMLIADGIRISKLWPWTSGGVLVASQAKSSAQIIPISTFRTVAAPFEAIQSKPLLVEDSRSGIRTDDHQFANRTAVAVCSDGSLLFVGAFAEGGAVSLYEFAALLNSGKLNTPTVETALNMDGGPGAHVFIPALHLHFGSNAVTYVPDLIRLSEMPR